MDTESGLMYYRARYYYPCTGRFVTTDPIGFASGINFYVYVFNNPLNDTDPSGKGVFSCIQFFYYAWKCAERGEECRKKIDNEIDCEGLLNVLSKYNAGFLSGLYFKACYQSIPECQKKIEYGIKCSY
jgi:hypothetical protein